MTEEQRKRSRQYQREYYQSHRQERIEKTIEWKKKNPEKAKEYSRKYFKKYYANNKDRIMQRRKELHPRKMVEVTRCKDCAYGEKCNSVYLCGKDRGFGLAHEPDFFCADGERKEVK